MNSYLSATAEIWIMLISLLTFTGYQVMNHELIFSRNLKSISQSYDKIEHPWMFQAMIWIQAISFGLIGNTVLFYISAVLLSLVAMFPTIKNEKHLVWHMIGAIGSIIIGFISLGVDYENWYPSIIMAVTSILCLILFKNYILVIELAAYYLVWIALAGVIYSRYLMI